MRVTEIAQYNYFAATNNINKKSPNFTSSPLSAKQVEAIADLKVFNHHIYEFKKGLRNLILTTEKAKHRQIIEERLQKNEIPYVIHEINSGKTINVYFGAEECVNVVKTFNPKLNELSAEQDFILGIMLGYDRVKQCDRYLKLKNKLMKLSALEK